MKRNLHLIFVLIIAVLTLNSCVMSKYNATVYKEQSIKSSDVIYKKVAILPNRLPVNLQNPESWRKYNWKIIKDNLERKDLIIIDYETSVQMFESSGLPVEDTKSSRDKYAELADKLGADILIFPYYGTSYYMNPGFFFNKNHYLSIGTLQLYLAGENDFLCRIDFEGDRYYNKSGMGALIVSFVPTLIGSMAQIPELSYVSIGAMALSQINDLVLSFTSPEKHWEKAFRGGINKGMDIFTQTYPVNKTYQNTDDSNETTREYGKYSIKELEQMKKKAVENRDYKKAGEIKKEIDRRNN